MNLSGIAESIRIGSPYKLKDILKQLDEHLSKGELIKLFQKGITEAYYDDFVEGYYLNPLNGLIFRLTCETYHGSRGYFEKKEICIKDLSAIVKENWKYTFYNWKSRILILSCVGGSVGIYEVEYPLDIYEVENYFMQGATFLDQLYEKIRSYQPNNKRIIKIENAL